MLTTTVQNNVIPADISEILALIVALSMMLTPLLFILYEKLRLLGEVEGTKRADDTIDEQGAVIIVGIGRFGQIINRMALAAGIKTVVIDHHIDQIEQMRKFGVKGYFGDPTRPELMHAAGLAKAKVLVIAVDQPKAALTLVKHARRERPDLHIIARAYDRTQVYELYRAGATDIVRETFDSSVRASKYLLAAMGWNSFDAENAAEAFVKADSGAVRELAELWNPDIPIPENAAYVERARAINSEFHTGFLANLAQIVEQDVKEEEEQRQDEAKTSSE